MVTRINPKRSSDRHYIAEWRMKRGLSQEALADRIGTTKATISRWENNERDITFMALVAVAEALDLRVIDLLRDPGEPSADALLRQNPEKRQGAVEMVKTFLKTFETSPIT
jgi:transcriptional regulator with XRE-family HTH domain